MSDTLYFFRSAKFQSTEALSIPNFWFPTQQTFVQCLQFNKITKMNVPTHIKAYKGKWLTVSWAGTKGNVRKWIRFFSSPLQQKPFRLKFFGIDKEFRIMAHEIDWNNNIRSLRVCVFVFDKERIELKFVLWIPIRTVKSKCCFRSQITLLELWRNFLDFIKIQPENAEMSKILTNNKFLLEFSGNERYGWEQSQGLLNHQIQVV